MAQNSALSTLKDLAEKEVDDAALQLGAMRRGCQQAEEQLKMLIDYQHEYRTNLNTDMTQGIGSQRWINYQQFIQTLEKAIEQHRQQLNQWTQKWIPRSISGARKTAAAGLANVTGPADCRLDPGGKPSGSEKMDEFAQRASMRKPE